MTTCLTASSKSSIRPTETRREMPAPPGYCLIRKLGRGGMGEIYLARHRRSHGLCAIKVIRADKRDEPMAVKRFQMEIQALSALRHPHIVRLLDTGRCADDREFIVMEFVDGKNLDQLVRKHGPLPVDRIVEILLQICSALSAVHAKGYAHCDLKPANIVMAEAHDGSTVAKLLDFGLVATCGPQRSALSETLTAGFVGSPLYAPPESALGLMDARSDIYSLGATAYHLLVGRPVFDVVDPVRAVYAHAVQDPHSAREFRRDANPLLDEIILKCLRKNPDERYQSMDELAAALLRMPAVGRTLTGRCCD